VPEPPRGQALYCGGWFPADELGHQMSASHSSVWLYGEGAANLFLGSPVPLQVRISVDGVRRSMVMVSKLLPDLPTPVRLGSRRWHLVTLDSGPLPEVRGRPRGVRILAAEPRL